jgi:hypothetical protein
LRFPSDRYLPAYLLTSAKPATGRRILELPLGLDKIGRA